MESRRPDRHFGSTQKIKPETQSLASDYSRQGWKDRRDQEDRGLRKNRGKVVATSHSME
jgi:hypothetical protein